MSPTARRYVFLGGFFAGLADFIYPTVRTLMAGKPWFAPWKGVASYYDVVVNGELNRDAAWYYPDPKPAAANVKDHVAFWRGVVVEP